MKASYFFLLLVTCGFLCGAQKEKIEDLAIIGGGPAGLTAAIYTSRSSISPVVFTGDMPGGQLVITKEVENYPGFPDGVLGGELVEKMEKQAQRFGARIVYEKIVKLEVSEQNGKPLFILKDGKGDFHRFRSVIIASGAAAKLLENVEGHKEFWQKGVSACAICDGALPIFRNKPLVVVGGGDSAMEEASYLSQFASKVYLIHRKDHFRASKIMQDRVFSNPKIEIVWNAEVKKIKGSDFVSSVVVEKNGKPVEIQTGGLFYAIGHTPSTDFLQGSCLLTEKGLVRTMGMTKTLIPGLFAAGDCVDDTYRQAITAAAFGCMAGLDAESYLREE